MRTCIHEWWIVTYFPIGKYEKENGCPQDFTDKILPETALKGVALIFVEHFFHSTL